jgi:hypothetical protein
MAGGLRGSGGDGSACIVGDGGVDDGGVCCLYAGGSLGGVPEVPYAFGMSRSCGGSSCNGTVVVGDGFVGAFVWRSGNRVCMMRCSSSSMSASDLAVVGASAGGGLVAVEGAVEGASSCCSSRLVPGGSRGEECAGGGSRHIGASLRSFALSVAWLRSRLLLLLASLSESISVPSSAS